MQQLVDADRIDEGELAEVEDHASVDAGQRVPELGYGGEVELTGDVNGGGAVELDDRNRELGVLIDVL